MKGFTKHFLLFYTMLLMSCIADAGTFVATPESLSDPTNAYKTAIVSQDVNLLGQTISLAPGVELLADGGILSNGTIVMQTGNAISTVSVRPLFDNTATINYEDGLYPQDFYLEWLGVVDGVADNSVALQKAINFSERVVLSPGTVYVINQRVYAERAGTLSIEGNGATIIVTESGNHETVRFAGDLESVELRNLTFDGKGLAAKAFLLQRSFIVENVTVKNLYSNIVGVYAYRIDINAQTSHAELLNSNCDNVDADRNFVIGDSIGASRCIMVQWYSKPAGLDVNITGGTYSNVWGDDGDILQVIEVDNEAFGSTASRLVLNGTTFANASRRLIKGTSSALVLRSSSFYSAPKDHPKVLGSTPAGMLSIADPLSNGVLAREILIEDCIFNNITSENETPEHIGELGHDGRIVFTNVENITLSDNVFHGISTRFEGITKDIGVENNQFLSNSSVEFRGSFFGEAHVQNNMVEHLHVPGVRAAFRGWVQVLGSNNTLDTITIENNSLTTNSEAGDIVFGILWAAGQSSDPSVNNVIKKIRVEENLVNRQGSVERPEIMRIDVNLDASSSIINNKLDSQTAPYYSDAGISMRNQNGVFIPEVEGNLFLPTGQVYTPNLGN